MKCPVLPFPVCLLAWLRSFFVAVRAFLSCAREGCSPGVMRGLLGAVASLAEERGLWNTEVRSRGAGA